MIESVLDPLFGHGALVEESDDARLDAHGYMQITDRFKDMIKVGDMAAADRDAQSGAVAIASRRMPRRKACFSKGWLAFVPSASGISASP